MIPTQFVRVQFQNNSQSNCRTKLPAQLPVWTKLPVVLPPYSHSPVPGPILAQSSQLGSQSPCSFLKHSSQFRSQCRFKAKLPAQFPVQFQNRIFSPVSQLSLEQLTFQILKQSSQLSSQSDSQIQYSAQFPFHHRRKLTVLLPVQIQKQFLSLSNFGSAPSPIPKQTSQLSVQSNSRAMPPTHAVSWSPIPEQLLVQFQNKAPSPAPSSSQNANKAPSSALTPNAKPLLSLLITYYCHTAKLHFHSQPLYIYTEVPSMSNPFYLALTLSSKAQNLVVTQKLILITHLHNQPPAPS